MTLRAGIVGCGRIGCGFDDDPNRGYVSTHAGAYVRVPGVTLVGLADVNTTLLQTYGDKFGVAGRYTSHKQMLAEARLDLVSICTWNDTHAAIVKDAVAAGVKGIFCEKPIAESLAAADEMVSLCTDRGVVLMIDYMRRFDPFHQEIARFLQGGRLGRIQQVTAYYTAGLANTGSHLLDLLRFYFGDVEWVEGRLSAAAAPNRADPNVDGWVWFKQGFGAALQACDVLSYLVLEVHVLGTEGRLRVLSSGFDLSYEIADASSRFAGYRELRGVPNPIATDRRHEFMLDGVKHLLACVEGRETPLCGGEDGRRALELVCALRESADTGGRRIDLPLSNSTVTIQSR